MRNIKLTNLNIGKIKTKTLILKAGGLFVILFFFLFALSSKANSAEIYINKYDNLVIKGSIEMGDYDKFFDLIKDIENKRLVAVELDSGGGNLIEAIRIGYHISFTRMSTLTLTKCVSACTMIFFAGKHYAATDRANISMHKPYLKTDDGVIQDKIGSDTWWRVYGFLISTLKDEKLARAILGFMYSTEEFDLYRIKPEQYHLFKILSN